MQGVKPGKKGGQMLQMMNRCGCDRSRKKSRVRAQRAPAPQLCSPLKPPGANLSQASGFKVPAGEENLGLNPSSYAN